jgi:YggT family protein
MNNIYRVLYGLTEPLLAPLRRVIPPVRMGMGYLDLSPLLLLFLLNLLRNLVAQYFFRFGRW